MLSVGPTEDEPVPKGSIIICWHCEKVIGRINVEIRREDDLNPARQIDFIDPPDKPDAAARYCTTCGSSIFSNGGLMEYYPMENLPSKILLFIMGLAPIV